MSEELQHWHDRAEAAEAEVQRLQGVIDGIVKSKNLQDCWAENERLRAVVSKVARKHRYRCSCARLAEDALTASQR